MQEKQQKMTLALKRFDEHLRDLYGKFPEFAAEVSVEVKVNIRVVDIAQGVAVIGDLLTSNEEMLELVNQRHNEVITAATKAAEGKTDLHDELSKVRREFMDNMALSPTDDFFLLLKQYEEKADQAAKKFLPQ